MRGLGASPLAVGGVADHVHILAGMRATQNVAEVVREVKKASSVWGSERYERFGWQTGYAAFSVGHAELARIANYIGRQEAHHRVLTSRDELRALLVEHGIEIDERYFD